MLVALMHSSGNLFQSFTTLWENVYFLISNLEWHFTKARLCPLVVLSFFTFFTIFVCNFDGHPINLYFCSGVNETCLYLKYLT